MDGTLTILTLGPMKMVPKLNRKTLRALEKSGHHNVPRRNQEVSGVVRSARHHSAARISTLLSASHRCIFRSS